MSIYCDLRVYINVVLRLFDNFNYFDRDLDIGVGYCVTCFDASLHLIL